MSMPDHMKEIVSSVRALRIHCERIATHMGEIAKIDPGFTSEAAVIIKLVEATARSFQQAEKVWEERLNDEDRN